MIDCIFARFNLFWKGFFSRFEAKNDVNPTIEVGRRAFETEIGRDSR